MIAYYLQVTSQVGLVLGAIGGAARGVDYYRSSQWKKQALLDKQHSPILHSVGTIIENGIRGAIVGPVAFIVGPVVFVSLPMFLLKRRMKDD